MNNKALLKKFQQLSASAVACDRSYATAEHAIYDRLVEEYLFYVEVRDKPDFLQSLYKKEGIKGLGSAAKTMAVDVPVEAARAGMNRMKYGEKLAKGGSVSSASRRADGIAQRGKTKGTMVAMCGGGRMKK